MSFFGARRTGLVFAADLSTLADNARVLEAIVEDVDVIKVGTPLILAEGTSVIEELRSRFDRPVFADIKVADVPHTNAKLIGAMRNVGAAAVMVHGIIGPTAVAEAVEAADGEVGIILQVELTNDGGDLFTADHALDLVRMGRFEGVYGFQAPGNRPERVRQIRAEAGEEAVLVCCGIGVQGGSFAAAVAAGGTHPIVGRSIYASDDPARACARIIGREGS